METINVPERAEVVSPDPKSCAICERPPTEGVTMRNSGRFDGLLIECPRCGKYEMVGPLAFGLVSSWPWSRRNALSCAARQASDSGQPLTITYPNAAELAAPHEKTRISDNIDRLLFHVAKRSERPGGRTTFDLNADFTVIDCYDRAEFDEYIKWTGEAGLIFWAGTSVNLDENGTPILGREVFASLTMAGWSRVQPLARTGGIPGRCFVAMWFSDVTRAAYDSGIEPAVKEAGFTPIRIDRKEHNNEIPDEIIAEIRNCEFMVADFTGQRAGVYYEAGFAMGLGRPVIWCCRKDEISRLHFDTNHKNHIPWATPEELREGLYRRIRATILEQG
jgi:hypothetical protein